MRRAILPSSLRRTTRRAGEAMIKAKSNHKLKSSPKDVRRRILKVLDALEGGRHDIIDRLPFAEPMNRLPRRTEQKLRDFWYDVKSTGNWAKDQKLGSDYAYLALQAIKAERFQPLLGWIVLGMIENKCPKHIVVGFFQTVADIALGLHKIPDIRVRLARSVQS